LVRLRSCRIKVVGHPYFDMFTDKAIGGAAVLLSYAVFLTMLLIFDLSTAHGKAPKIIEMDSTGPAP